MFSGFLVRLLVVFQNTPGKLERNRSSRPSNYWPVHTGMTSDKEYNDVNQNILEIFGTMNAPTSTISYLHDEFNYTDEHHARYERDGYLFCDSFLSADGLARCRKECDRMIDNLQPGRSPQNMISPHQQERWIFDLASEPKLLDMFEKQIGPNIVLWSSHMLCKAPHTGEYVPWHQDAPYWNMRGNFSSGIWIPFDKIDHDNGAMSVVPGWHKNGQLPRRDSGLSEFNEEIEPAALPENIDEVKVEYLLDAGQAALHHVMMPHNSPPNQADRWRRVLVLRYIAADGEFGNKTYEDYRTGEPFERECFLMRGQDVDKKGLRRSPFEH